MTTTTGPSGQALRICSTCSGTGWDSVFRSPCGDCAAPARTVHADPAEPSAPTPTRTATGGATRSTGQRPNQYPGACTRCAGWVDAGAGTIARVGDKWQVAHVTCPTTQPAPTAAAVRVAGPSVDVPEGHYAVVSRTGNNDLDFYRVDRPADGRWAGRVFVKRIIGGHPAEPVRGSEAQAALEAIAANPAEAARRYGQEIGRCHVCNRTLTDETSRALGIGPDCARKEG